MKPDGVAPREPKAELTVFTAIYCVDCGDFIGTTSKASPPPVRCGACRHLHDRLQPLSEKLDRIITLLERLS